MSRNQIRNYRNLHGHELANKVDSVLETVHLTPVRDFRDKYPFQLSGGQLQHVVIARAIASNPQLIVADEPVSMLVVSIRADILHLIADLRAQQGVSFLYLTHDLVSARMLTDEIIVLYRGTVVERGDANVVVRTPLHTYTQLLLRSIPNPWAKAQVGLEAKLTPPASSAPHAGCVFRSRCPHAMQVCDEQTPELRGADGSRAVACFLYNSESARMAEPSRETAATRTTTNQRGDL